MPTRQPTRHRVPLRLARVVLLALPVLFLAVTPGAAHGQIPKDQFHISLSLGGYVMFGVGYTHWVEKHHALETTVYPFAYPWDGIPCAVKLGYAWIPSNEAVRAKLGGNFTLLLHDHEGTGSRFTPVLAFTPGIQYDPTNAESVRWDFWMSYYPTQGVFAPTALETLFSWEG